MYSSSPRLRPCRANSYLPLSDPHITLMSISENASWSVRGFGISNWCVESLYETPPSSDRVRPGRSSQSHQGRHKSTTAVQRLLLRSAPVGSASVT
jgi:hypothetical protein